MWQMHQYGHPLHDESIFRIAGFEPGQEPEDCRIDRIFRRCKAFGSDGEPLPKESGREGDWARDDSRLVGPTPVRKGFYQINL